MPRAGKIGLLKLVLLCVVTLGFFILAPVSMQAQCEPHCPQCDCCLYDECTGFHYYVCGTLGYRCINHPPEHYCSWRGIIE